MKTASPQLGRMTHLLAQLLLCTCIFTAAANALGQTYWTAGTADWKFAGNWMPELPNSLTSAYINNGGTARVFVRRRCRRIIWDWARTRAVKDRWK